MKIPLIRLGIIPSQGADDTWSVTLPNTDGTYVFTAAAGDEEATCTVKVTYKSSGSRPSSGSGTSSLAASLREGAAEEKPAPKKRRTTTRRTAAKADEAAA